MPSDQDKDSMKVLIRVLRTSRSPEERMWLARQIENTAIEDGWLRPEFRPQSPLELGHPRSADPPTFNQAWEV